MADGELRVLCAGAMKALVGELAGRFGAQAQRRVELEVGTAGELRRRAALEPSDLVIVTREVIADLAEQGVLDGDTRSDLARVGVGVALRAGRPLPDLSSAAALRELLLRAESLAYPDPANGATAGIHMADVLARLGIAEGTGPKRVLCASGSAACQALSRGQAELCATQISEILAEPGVALAGPLPRELQKVTVYSGAVTRRSQAPELARSFLALLCRPSTRERLAAAGLDYRD